MWTRAQLDDGTLDALALTEAATARDEEALAAVLSAYAELDGLPLIVSLLALIDRLLADPAEWAARIRAGMTVP